jgi:hypothetical protein
MLFVWLFVLVVPHRVAAFQSCGWLKEESRKTTAVSPENPKAVQDGGALTGLPRELLLVMRQLSRIFQSNAIQRTSYERTVRNQQGRLNFGVRRR